MVNCTMVWGSELPWWLGGGSDTQPGIPQSTPLDQRLAVVTHSVTHREAAETEAKRQAVLAERVVLPLRKRHKKAPLSDAERQARRRAKDRKGSRQRHAKYMQMWRARQKAAKDAAAQVAQAVAAGVVDLGAVRAARAAEAPQAVVDDVPAVQEG